MRRHCSSTPSASTVSDPIYRVALIQGLRTLPHRQRAAIVLRYFEGLSEQEVADTLGCSVAALKSLVTRGKRSLQEHLQDRGS